LIKIAAAENTKAPKPTAENSPPQDSEKVMAFSINAIGRTATTILASSAACHLMGKIRRVITQPVTTARAWQVKPAHAAPNIPYLGINRRFMTMFTTADGV
jgi:hypothetical protein